MLRDTIANMGWAITAIIALVLFFGAFVAVVIYVMTRPKKDIDKQAKIPMTDDVVEPRNGGSESESRDG